MCIRTLYFTCKKNKNSYIHCLTMTSFDFRQKNVKCIEWIVRAPSFPSVIVSKNFTLQDCRCNLEFSLGINDTCLYFRSDKKLSPLTVTVRVDSNTAYLGSQRELITSSFQKIWNYEGASILCSMLTFEVTIDGIFLKDDKSAQTPSYIDTNFDIEHSSKDLLKLLDDGPYHDVEFTCGDQIIMAHKNILSCRSSVFSTMLQTDMVEGKTGRVNILDTDASTFKQFLGSLYTGVLPELTFDIAIELYKASDKYAVHSMKKQCAEFLRDNLSLINVCEVLVLADQHNDPDLKKNVMEYIFKEKVPVVAKNWAEFCKEHLVLSNEVLNSFCKHICQN